MGNKEGERFGIGDDETLTVNPTDNPDVEGGWYQTTTNSQGDKSTAVYDRDGNMPSGSKMGDNDSYE
ncbi:hypothetical protein PZ938_02415 [Luteipulveratus sp. YIM 133132]|uniref:hypothetical protein n=1 Tax=Luteipulveratus flavus TaxID=3031728 RepID=UPI0023AEEB01|nr:hypothetical protein [Luteipulveratus sp. YIM 133132]MDE9364448.1 hypothetical protein [Luteipulveratus sp. YIM 133132]